MKKKTPNVVRFTSHFAEISIIDKTQVKLWTKACYIEAIFVS